METMVMVAIAMAFILPILILFFSSASIQTQTLSQVQARVLAQQMADAAGQVWYEGNGSRKVLMLNYLNNLLNISLGGDNVSNQICPPAQGPFASITTSQLNNASREITLTLSNSPGGTIQVVSAGPAMVCDNPLHLGNNLTYDQFHVAGAPLTAGLVLVVFKNEGPYIDIYKQPLQR